MTLRIAEVLQESSPHKHLNGMTTQLSSTKARLLDVPCIAAENYLTYRFPSEQLVGEGSFAQRDSLPDVRLDLPLREQLQECA